MLDAIQRLKNTTTIALKTMSAMSSFRSCDVEMNINWAVTKTFRSATAPASIAPSADLARIDKPTKWSIPRRANQPRPTVAVPDSAR